VIDIKPFVAKLPLNDRALPRMAQIRRITGFKPSCGVNIPASAWTCMSRRLGTYMAQFTVTLTLLAGPEKVTVTLTHPCPEMATSFDVPGESFPLDG